MHKNRVDHSLTSLARESSRKSSLLGIVSMIIFAVGMSVANPVAYKAFEVAFSTDISSFGGTIALAFVCLPFIMLVSAIISSEIEGFKKSSKSIGGKDGFKIPDSYMHFKVKVLPAEVILIQNKMKLAQDLKYIPSVYLVAGTEKYVLANTLLSPKYKTQSVFFLVACLVVSFFLSLIGGDVNWFFILGHALAVVFLIILCNILLSLAWARKISMQLQRIKNNSSVPHNRLWAEYVFVVKRKLESNGIYKNVHSIANTSIEVLLGSDMAKNRQVKHLLDSLKELCINAYSAMDLINDNTCDSVATKDNNKHKENIEKILLIINSYIPACIKQLEKSFKAPQTVVDHNNDMLLWDNLQVMVFGNKKDKAKGAEEYSKNCNTTSSSSEPYILMRRDIEAQNQTVLAIQAYYEEVVNNGVLNGFQNVIDNQSSGWSFDKKEFYSLKTQVLDEKLNGKVIPELKALMVNADLETRIRIDGKIKDVTEFFNEQVELDKQAASVMALDYDRTVAIIPTDNAIPQKDAAEAYLTNIDFYLDQLKKNW